MTHESLAILALGLAPALVGCAAATEAAARPQGLEFGATQQTAAQDGDDHALCEWKGQADREESETAGAGAIHPNVRRVYQVFGHGADSRKILVCREVDTNLDGYKDVVRRYNDEGQSREEQDDGDGDGKIDTWTTFSKGRLAQVDLDTNHDGKPDVWKTYGEGGKLSRIKRDSNFDEKPDVWEMYRAGRLERMGVDLTGDQRVDRWDHDTEWRRELDKQDRKKDADAVKKKEEELERIEKAALEAADKGDGATPPKAPPAAPKSP
ncbi:MAG: hypothetical protein HY908_14070 [Myxococcales bacterium]|nr:hypothetical protein [Myxococcales bacterium]